VRRKTLDVENYVNYFLVLIRDLETGDVWQCSMYNDVYSSPTALSDLRVQLTNITSVTFNGSTYDMPLVTLFLAGATNHELYTAGANIIRDRLMPWIFERTYNVTIPDWDHIDLINVAFGTASLKIYGARLGSKLLQELPIHWDNFIMPDEISLLGDYCINDNIVTADLYKELEPAITLRADMSKEFGVDLRSKSDAQIAEYVIKSEYQKATGLKLKAPKALESYRYHAPSFIFFQGEQLKELLATCEDAEFKISAKGAVVMPATLNKQIEVAGKKFKIGIGGLHSVDNGASYYSGDGYSIMDVDATSFYPYVILNGGFEPSHIGELFTIIYREIVERRVTAKPIAKKLWKEIEALKYMCLEVPPDLQSEYIKQSGIVESLKIVINGLFGKFGSRYSVVYSPDLMFHTTVTGQLCLFMLIEQFAVSNIQVISANTDGITIRVHDDKREHLEQLIQWWNTSTGLNMEYTHYKSVHYRDVNNYIALPLDPTDKVKGIGIFAKDGIRKNPANAIIRDACVAYAKDGTEPEVTINNATDITKFLQVMKVTGGAQKDGVPLGASIRWYISDATDTAINYVSNGNQVQCSMNAMPMMNLPDDGVFPPDLDYQWYIDEANEVLIQIGLKFRFYMHHDATDEYYLLDNTIARDYDLVFNGSVELTERVYNKRVKAQLKLQNKTK